MAVWPAALPDAFRLGFTDTRRQGVLRTGMDAGPDKIRRRYSETTRALDAVVLILNGEERMILEDFYLYELEAGSLPFTITDPNSLAPVSCRFIEPPTFQTVAGAPDRYDQQHRTVMKIELLDSSIYGPTAGPFINRVLGDGGTLMKSRVETDQGIRGAIDNTQLAAASLAMVSEFGAYKTGKLYSQLPISGAGDFNVERTTVKWVMGPNAQLIQWAANTPAFEYNTDGTYRGLLVEPSAVNLALRSEDLSTTWINTNTTESTNAVNAPNGTLTADLLIPNNGTSLAAVPRLTQTISKAASATTYTMSAWVKNGGFNRALIRFRDNSVTANEARVTFNLDTGVADSPIVGGTFTSVSASVSSFPSGWYRISVAATTSTETTLELALGVLDSVATTGDGIKGVYFWGVQFETGSVATSYIPTVASTQTRTADSVTLTGASSLIGQSAGTIYVEMEGRLAGANRTLISVSDGTNNNRINLQVGGGNTTETRIVSGGVTQGAIDAGAPSASVRRWAIRYSSSGATLYRDGASVGTPLGAITIPATSIVRLGVAPDGSSNFLNGWLRHAVLFTSDIGNTSAIALTTP